MPSMNLSQALVVLLAIGAAAQDGPVTLCTDDQCGNCPNAVTTAGTGYPACVIYDRDTVLGGSVDSYEALPQNQKQVYFDIAPLGNPECRTIIRSPASTTDKNCGTPIFAGGEGACFPGKVSTTFMVQYCCGTGDCGAAGAKRSIYALGGASSAVLRDGEGNVIIPSAVGDDSGDMFGVFMEDMGLNSSSVVQSRSANGSPVFKIGYGVEDAMKKRDCDTYTPNGAPYTKTGTQSYQVSGEICDSTSKVTIENSQSISRTTTFGVSVGDPYGIVSASIDFSTEKTSEQSYSYEFTPMSGQCGHVSWTPFFDCTGGTITGCDGGDQTGEVCTAKRIDKNQIDGRYGFVQTN